MFLTQGKCRRRIECTVRTVTVGFLCALVCTNSLAAECRPSPADLAWLDQTATVWNKVRSGQLHLKPSKLPWMVVFDGRCVLNINPASPNFDGKTSTMRLGDEIATVSGRSHNGIVTLPDEAQIPARVISFAANYDGDRGSFFTAALPSVWAQDENLKAEPRLASLVRAVYVHELTHTNHRNFFARLTVIEKQLVGVDKFDDDIIQNRFGKDEAFRESYLAEIESAQKAVSLSSRKERKVAARNLLDSIRQRRSRYYTGDNSKFAEIEDIFLTMEGVANWAGYRAALADGLSDVDAQHLIRRSGKFWSQEEGILLFLLIDSLVHDWQKSAFSGERASVTKMLERAVR